MDDRVETLCHRYATGMIGMERLEVELDLALGLRVSPAAAGAVGVCHFCYPHIGMGAVGGTATCFGCGREVEGLVIVAAMLWLDGAPDDVFFRFHELPPSGERSVHGWIGASSTDGTGGWRGPSIGGQGAPPSVEPGLAGAPPSVDRAVA